MLELFTVDALYHLRLILTIVTQVVLHVLILVLFLQRFNRSRKIYLWFKKLVWWNFVLRFELELMLGVYVHVLVDHLRQVLSIHTIKLSCAHFTLVLVIRLRYIFVPIVIWNVALRILLPMVLHNVLLILLVLLTVLELLSIYGWLSK